MTENSRLLNNVIERDLDLVLMGALFASEAFRAFMLNSAMGWTKKHSLVRTCVSETADAGESDVLLVVDLEDSDRSAVMIEDKITAPFQPQQADRYRQRGEQGIQSGHWNRYTTCLCAPEGYLVGARQLEEWCAYVSLESISQWARQSNDRYAAFLAAICDEAVAKLQARVREKSAESSAFWQAYRELAELQLPGVDVTRVRPLVGLASPWPRYGAGILPASMWLEHKPQKGCVDLTFKNTTPEALKRRLLGTPPFNVPVAKAGRSAALRIAVPRVDHLRPFHEQQEKVLSAFAAVERLLAIGRQIAATPSGT